MRIVVFDQSIIYNKSYYYLKISGSAYNDIIQKQAEILNLRSEDIDEILILSNFKSDNEKVAKFAECDKLESEEGYIKIFYKNIKDSDLLCEQLRKQVYHYAKTKDIMTNDGYLPQIILMDKIQDYTRIVSKGMSQEVKSFMRGLEELKLKNNWINIVESFPDMNIIEKTEYWNNFDCLSTLSFALSQLSIKYHDKKLKKNSKYDKYFIKISNRCLEINPDNVMANSTRAYYYYNMYMNDKRDELFEKAEPLYQKLITTSNECYKEKYRYTKLKHDYFKNNCWNGKFAEKWFDTIDDIVKNYQELIDSYHKLDENRAKKYKTQYIRSLFGLSTLQIEFLYDYWGSYVNYRLNGVQVKSYKLANERLLQIKKTEDNLSEILKINFSVDSEKYNLDNKPSYMEVQYRIAQIKQIEGIVYILSDKENGSRKFFIKSNEEADKCLNCADSLKKLQSKKFLYPYYSKQVKAINYYFLNDREKIDGCFYNAREYMKFEKGRIYALWGDKEKAIQILSEIPPNDTCYNKSQKLIESLQ